MTMSDAEYQRIVDELKANKKHLPGARDPEVSRMFRNNVVAFLEGLSADAAFYRHRAASRRAAELAVRCRTMPPQAVSFDLHELAHAEGMRLHYLYDRATAADFTQVLTRIHARVEADERAAR